VRVFACGYCVFVVVACLCAFVRVPSSKPETLLDGSYITLVVNFRNKFQNSKNSLNGKKLT
jgi:hypothetical protein